MSEQTSTAQTDWRAATSGALQDDRRCFACGPDNENGLRLQFEYFDKAARCVFVPQERFAGWVHMLHGGIVATLLDEAMAHAAIAAGIRAVTARLAVRFRKAAPANAPIVLEGKLVRQRGRVLELSATVAAPDGTLYAEGQGRFLADQ